MATTTPANKVKVLPENTIRIRRRSPAGSLMRQKNIKGEITSRRSPNTLTDGVGGHSFAVGNNVSKGNDTYLQIGKWSV